MFTQKNVNKPLLISTEIEPATPISAQQPHQQQNFNVGRNTNRGNFRGGEVTEAEAENLFENQVIPVGLHNLSKSFGPKLPDGNLKKEIMHSCSIKTL